MNTDCKVLVVGGAGYIGGLVVDLLQEANYDVTVYDSLLYESRYLKPCNLVFGDIRDTDKLVAESHKHDYIILLAGLVGDPACQVNVKATEDINFHAVRDFTQRLRTPKNLSLSLPALSTARKTTLLMRPLPPPLSLRTHPPSWLRKSMCWISGELSSV